MDFLVMQVVGWELPVALSGGPRCTHQSRFMNAAKHLQDRTQPTFWSFLCDTVQCRPKPELDYFLFGCTCLKLHFRNHPSSRTTGLSYSKVPPGNKGRASDSQWISSVTGATRQPYQGLTASEMMVVRKTISKSCLSWAHCYSTTEHTPIILAV